MKRRIGTSTSDLSVRVAKFLSGCSLINNYCKIINIIFVCTVCSTFSIENTLDVNNFVSKYSVTIIFEFYYIEDEGWLEPDEP